MQNTNVKNSIKVIVFLILEVLCFTAFTLTNNVILYAVASVILVFGILFTNMDNIRGKDFLPCMVMLIPLILFGIMLLVSPFTKMVTGLGENLLAFIAMVVFLILGYLSQTLPNFNLTKAMIVIYSGIAVYVLIAFIMTMVSYTPFYTWIYKNSWVYYQGERIPLGISCKMLFGFEITDISIEYFQLFPTLLFTSIVALRFINPKENLREFLIFLGFALFGFLNMIFMINKVNMVTSTLVILGLLLITFWPKNNRLSQVFSIILFGFLIIIGIVAIVFLMNAINPIPFIESNAFLNKIFNTNLFARNFNEMINATFNADAVFGYTPEITSDNKIKISSIHESGNIWLDNMEFSGVIGGVFFFLFGCVAVYKVIRYFRSDRDDEASRHLLVGFLLTFFIYTFFAYDSTPCNPYTCDYKFMPYYFNGIVMICMFLIGRACKYGAKDKVSATDNLNVTTAQTFNNDEITENVEIPEDIDLPEEFKIENVEENKDEE